MAIAFDAASDRVTGAGASITFAHTCTGSNRILFVTAGIAGGGTISGVTYNGVAMTLIASAGLASLFYLIAPATGANNIVITKSGGTTIFGTGSSYAGASQVGIPDSSATNTSTASTSVSQSTTTVKDNCWVVCGGLCGNGSVSAGTNVTLRTSANNDVYIGDNNAAKTPAGSITQTVSCANGNNSIVMASFAPPFEGTLTMAVGSYLLNGVDVVLGRLQQVALAVGTFTLTGVALAFSVAQNTWKYLAKSVSTWTNTDKS